jgi:hypothetical protein
VRNQKDGRRIAPSRSPLGEVGDLTAVSDGYGKSDAHHPHFFFGLVGVLSSLMRSVLRIFDGVRDPGILHLLPRLLAPAHFHFRIRVPGVGRRVVVMRGRLKPPAFGNYRRFVENVIGLPVETIFRRRQRNCSWRI